MTGTCQTCGVVLPPKTWKGRDRKFCSEYCRKRQYDLICLDCGARVNGTTPSRIPARGPRCKACMTIWTREALIAAIQDWADEHGGIPPTQPCWNPSHPGAQSNLRAEYATGRWPSHVSVRRVFGSWNNGLIAAGFEPHPVVNRTPPFDALVEEVRAGHSARELAQKYGVTDMAIYMKFKYRGLWFSDFTPRKVTA